jgi:hypothetical protein
MSQGKFTANEQPKVEAMPRNSLFTQKIWKASAVRSVRHALSIPRVYRYLSANRRRLPDFIIVGAAKGGTTSLWQYLIEHPDVQSPITKEVCFFDRNFSRGLDWYRMHFPIVATGRLQSTTKRQFTGESTPYYLFHPLVPSRIAESLPDVKIIVLLRDPIVRAFSHYQLKRKRRHETLSFEEAIAVEAERLAGEHERIVSDPNYYSAAHDRFSYLARGIYLPQIQRWQRYFPTDQLLILESGEFFRQTAEVFQRVLEFLGLPRCQPVRFGNRYPGGYTDKMSDAVRQRLVEYFAPHNEKLYAHLGTRYDWECPDKTNRNCDASAA